MILYSLKDNVIHEHLSVVQFKNVEQFKLALKMQLLACKNTDYLYQNSKNLDLFRLGSFDEHSGIIVSEVTKLENLGDLIELWKIEK